MVIGNPPWLSYRYMAQGTQERFKEECQRRGLWAGGKVATHQDLSGYFFVRCIELYLKQAGVIAFIMPYAAITRRQFEGFRTGIYEQRRGKRVGQVFAAVQFSEAWAMNDDVQPLFPVPSCVLFGRTRRGQGAVLPSTVLAGTGTLSQRDAAAAEADRALTWRETPWPAIADDDVLASPYRDAFQNGATFYPRMLCVVDPAPAGSLGANPAAPLVESRRTSQEKQPWKGLPSLRDNVEEEFLRPLYLGESVAPFRLLEPVLAVIPWDEKNSQLLDAAAAQQAGYIYLANWLGRAERLWAQHSKGGMTLLGQLDYYGKLSAQFPPPALQVFYSASGTLPAAALVRNRSGVVEHALYWIAPKSEGEALYLAAVLNSEASRGRVAQLQARGQWGARHFDKVMLSLPILPFDPSKRLHGELAEAATHAETVAATVPFKDVTHFVRARQLIRAALREDGVAQRIDGLVAELLAT